jgi:hypothetical protein
MPKCGPSWSSLLVRPDEEGKTDHNDGQDLSDSQSRCQGVALRYATRYLAKTAFQHCSYLFCFVRYRMVTKL